MAATRAARRSKADWFSNAPDSIGFAGHVGDTFENLTPNKSTCCLYIRERAVNAIGLTSNILSMSWKSGSRFSGKDMRSRETMERDQAAWLSKAATINGLTPVARSVVRMASRSAEVPKNR
jgi:hypothetical protein